MGLAERKMAIHAFVVCVPVGSGATRLILHFLTQITSLDSLIVCRPSQADFNLCIHYGFILCFSFLAVFLHVLYKYCYVWILTAIYTVYRHPMSV